MTLFSLFTFFHIIWEGMVSLILHMRVTPPYQRLYLKDTVTNTAGLIIRNEEFGNSQVKRNYDCFLEHMTPFL